MPEVKKNPSRSSLPEILVVTSTYPRWPEDTEPPFVQNLSRDLSKNYAVTVLAPHFRGAKRFERANGITVYLSLIHI